MNCNNCGNELSIAPEQVGTDSKGIPIYRRIARCPNCNAVYDLDIQERSVFNQQTQNTENEKSKKKKDSGISIAAAVLAFFTITAWLGAIFGIIDLIANRKDGKRHIGSWFAIIVGIIMIIISGSGDDTEKGKVENSSTNNVSTVEEDGPVNVGEYFKKDGLIVNILSADTDFKYYDNQYGVHDLSDGEKYIKVSFKFENTSSEQKYVSLYDFDCFADGELCEQYFYFGDGDFINTNLTKDRSVSFDTYYIVPIDSGSIELEYKVNMLTNERVLIKIK